MYFPFADGKVAAPQVMHELKSVCEIPAVFIEQAA